MPAPSTGAEPACRDGSAAGVVPSGRAATDSPGDDRLAVLAHELRSPVAALAAIADAFAATERRLAAADATRLLELAVAACRSIDRLVTDEDAFSVVSRRVELAPLLEEVAAGRADVQVDPGLTVSADPVRLRQAIGNLLENALRHGDTVRLAARSRGRTVAISVGDDGPGIPDDVDVFAPGVSGDGSTGYGLPIVRAIAARHGGHVELESTPGEGATFTLVLPSGAD